MRKPGEVKLKDVIMRKAGTRGVLVCLPQSWVDDMRLHAGEKITVYRDEDDRLIIAKQDGAA